LVYFIQATASGQLRSEVAGSIKRIAAVACAPRPFASSRQVGIFRIANEANARACSSPPLFSG